MTPSDPQLVIVTGASSGIGLATVKLLLQSGYSVLGLSRHFDDAIIDHPNLAVDSIDFADVEALPARFSELADRIDLPVAGVVNNAGLGKIGFLEQLSYDDLQVCMNVNFMSHAMLCKALLPRLKKQGYGTIVFVGSEAALAGSRQGSIYAASKFALRGFAQSLREECNRAGVRVGIINPGATDTAFFDDLHYRPAASSNTVISPLVVARSIQHMLEVPTGTVIDEINLSPLSRVWEKK